MKIIFDHLHGHVKDDRVFCEAFVIPEGETEEELLVAKRHAFMIFFD